MKFILNNKEYKFDQAMKILMKGQPKTTESRRQAYIYLMWKCRK
jgi:hypothetical protein